MNKSGFSSEEEGILLEKVKKYDVLIDCKIKNYKDTECKNDIWKDISPDMGKTVDETKKRWKNIRDSYFRYKRKLRTEAAAAKKPKWHLTGHLSFLDTVMHDRSSTSNVTETVSELLEEVTQDNDVSQNEEIEDSHTPQSSKKRTRENRMTSIIQKNSKERQAAMKRLTSQNEQILNMNKREDDIDLFCRSVAINLKGLPKRGQNEAKLKILGVVTDLDEKYNIEEVPPSIQTINSSVVSPESDVSTLLSPSTAYSNSSCSAYTLNLDN